MSALQSSSAGQSLRGATADLLRDLPSDAAFALRTSAAALLALYLAMSLHLDTPRWAAWTVLTVSVPSLDHAFVKSFYRMIGTIVGAAAGIVIVALFAQRPLVFDLAMALWAGACAFVGTRVRQYQSYALALTWLTSGIVSYGSVADPNGAFIVAASRTAEVALGILCAGGAAILFDGHRVATLVHAASPVPGQARRNGVRAGLAVMLASAFWYVSQWQDGPFFVLMSGAAALLFAAHPSKVAATLGMLRGFLLGTLLGLFVRFALFTRSASFGEETLVLLPFLMLGGIGLADSRTQGPATGYNLAFMLAADPANTLSFDLGGALNEAMAMIFGVLVSIGAFLGLVPIRDLLHRDGA
ncbi:MAG TPA: FUSC family protein [Acidiphilium sp.]|jgi:uncharacterized membrane protein YccC|uniref:FUSC family protein n=1 Tax=unclassified Acidiphilium TaxID=2617493 RepID=UPI00157B0D42|nr:MULTISPECIES: FUSC family protein [unclassified Acidiphilium]HQT60917.1 FUSC family protein [Acidiphilium sp.]HQU12437.1 FUSC family protein [Acidiphilium sp.]